MYTRRAHRSKLQRPLNNILFLTFKSRFSIDNFPDIIVILSTREERTENERRVLMLSLVARSHSRYRSASRLDQSQLHAPCDSRNTRANSVPYYWCSTRSAQNTLHHKDTITFWSVGSCQWIGTLIYQTCCTSSQKLIETRCTYFKTLSKATNLSRLGRPTYFRMMEIPTNFEGQGKPAHFGAMWIPTHFGTFISPSVPKFHYTTGEAHYYSSLHPIVNRTAWDFHNGM